MPINPNIKKILVEISKARKQNGISQEELEAKLFLGKGWINAIETGNINTPFDLMLAILFRLRS